VGQKGLVRASAVPYGTDLKREEAPEPLPRSYESTGSTAAGRSCASTGFIRAGKGKSINPARIAAQPIAATSSCQDRLRSFPPQAVFGPAFTPGSEGSELLWCQARLTGLLLVAAACRFSPARDRRPVERA
jgi:hypothetical protein